MLLFEDVKGIRVLRLTLTLPDERFIRRKAQPFEVFKDRGFILGPRTRPIVILDAEEHPAPKRAGHPPHRDGARDMPEMQIAGGRGGEARDEARSGRFDEEQSGQLWPER